MRIYLVFCILLVQSLMAVPLEYNNSAWYSGLDPYLVGKRENFMIQGVKVDAIRDANGFTGAFTAVLKFNYGGPSPAIGNLSTIAPYNFNTGGVVSALHAADLFFKKNGVIRYGIPLVDHGGPGNVNGNPMGNGLFDDGDLYQITGGVQTITSNQFLTPGTNPSLFGTGRTVRMTSGSTVQALQSGSTQIYFNGECTETVCPMAEYTVTFNLNGPALEGSDWYQFLVGVNDGSLTPYFTGSACGNDLLDGAVPEPSTWAMLGAGLMGMLWRGRRRL